MPSLILAHQFTVQPESMVQAEGLEAVFECLYPRATAHALGINGEFPSDDQFPPDVTRIPPSGDSPARLIIPATPQHNNTVVQCIAIMLSGPISQSENATLRVQGVFHLKFNVYDS